MAWFGVLTKVMNNSVAVCRAPQECFSSEPPEKIENVSASAGWAGLAAWGAISCGSSRDRGPADDRATKEQ